MNTMLPVLLLLISNFVLLIVSNYVTDDNTCPPITGDASSCLEINNRIYYESECDQSICGNDRMCNEYHEIANKLNCRRNADELRDFRTRNVTEFSNQPRTNRIRYTRNIVTSYFDYVRNDNCRRNTNYIEHVRNTIGLSNSSSFSPWEYVINIDENRIPREILETKCRCLLCLNNNRTDTTERYRTFPLMVTRYFHLKGHNSRVFHAKFSYGCVCQFDPHA